MSMRLMAKATQAEIEKKIEEEGQELVKSFDEVMEGLDQFIKSSVEKPKERKAEEEEAVVLKAIQSEKADMKKSVRGDDGGMELDGEQVFSELKETIAGMIAKAVVSIQNTILADVEKRFADQRDQQVLVAKALTVNGKILREAMHEVAEIGNQGRPRRSALTVFDKSMSGNGGAASETTVVDVNKIMAKAIKLNAEQKLSPNDVGIINHHVVAGQGIPQRFAHLFE